MGKLVISKKEFQLIKLKKGTSNILAKSGTRSALILSGDSLVHNKELKIVVESNSTVHFIIVSTGHKLLNNNMLIELAGVNSEAKVTCVFHGHQDEKHEYNIIMHHQARNTLGDIFIRAVYEDQSKGSFTGMIKIGKKAQQTNSYFTDNVLLLDKAMATSVPQLEIEANEVKASHASTTGRINEEQMFYLRSRGLPEENARKLVIMGFFQPAMKRLPQPVINYLK